MKKERGCSRAIQSAYSLCHPERSEGFAFLLRYALKLAEMQIPHP
jgi:hypothetical protein